MLKAYITGHSFVHAPLEMGRVSKEVKLVGKVSCVGSWGVDVLTCYARWSALGLLVSHRGGNGVVSRCMLCCTRCCLLVYQVSDIGGSCLVVLGAVYLDCFSGFLVSGYIYFFLSFLCSGMGVGGRPQGSWSPGACQCAALECVK